MKALPESGVGRSADASVNGVPTEFKSLEPGATNATVRNSVNASLRRGGQARRMVIDARGSGLTRDEAVRGIGRVRGIARGRLDQVRIVGDGFDITVSDF